MALTFTTQKLQPDLLALLCVVSARKLAVQYSMSVLLHSYIWYPSSQLNKLECLLLTSAVFRSTCFKALLLFVFGPSGLRPLSLC